MNSRTSWTTGFSLLVATLALATSAATADAQSLKSRFRIESSAGVLLYDQHLAFETSPSFRLGAGYRISNLLQLSLNFSFSPTRQAITQATTSTTARHGVYYTGIDFKFSRGPLLGRIRPFAGVGAGILLINPHTVILTLSNGSSIKVEPATDQHYTLDFMAGFEIPVFKSYLLKIELNRSLYSLNGMDGDSKLASNQQLNLGVVVGL